jgi:cytosine/adenosine deaminase-related metal-dependent hydrolase
MMWQLNDVQLIDQTGPCNIQVQGQRIHAIGTTQQPIAGITLRLEGALAFPGLINSHDHLDFNLFPPLGNRVYDNYMQWGRDIHQNNKATIQAVQRIPQALRAQWGIYKNLCGGVTTVVNHGPRLKLGQQLPITVFQRCRNLHSVGFDKHWKRQLQHPFRWRRPVVVHVGEGTDEPSRQEIDALLRANRFHRPLVGIHGVAITVEQAAGFHALVWCPASNLFLLGQTAAVDELVGHTGLLFGTDSTLTAPWDIWQHLRLARQLERLTEAALLDSLTVEAARIWGIKDTGSLAAGQVADMVVSNTKGAAGIDRFFATTPADILLVMHQGQLSLFDESLLPKLQAQGFATAGYDSLSIGQRTKYVRGPVQQLMAAIRQHHPAVQFFPENFPSLWPQ